MTDHNEELNQLQEKVQSLMKRQVEFAREINLLWVELNTLRTTQPRPEVVQEQVTPEMPITTMVEEIQEKQEVPKILAAQKEEVLEKLIHKTPPRINYPPKSESNLEKFIGENLANKVGIVITIIGVAIGAKYSIENGLISPLTRVITGYLFGLVLLGFGIKLKQNYKNYSAVLVSGAMAIMYFITFSAYGFYDLIPQVVAFALMLIFTVFTVIAALHYNLQIIAHIGLVGAYAVPFLLSDGSGRVVVLFSYMSILNMGILAIAFRKYWKQLYYVSFGLTWLIFLVWYWTGYQSNEHFGLALVFATLFFTIFYLTFLAYKLIRKEKYVLEDIILLLGNSFIFYALGYVILDNHPTGKQLLGLFTLANAVVHFVASVIIYRQKQADKDIHYLITGLVLVFITLAIPVQLDGNWVTLLWAGQAALLFWIGRTKSVSFYELVSFPLMVLAFLSLIQDWGNVYNAFNHEVPSDRMSTLYNVNFLSSVLFMVAFTFIQIVNQRKVATSDPQIQNTLPKLFSYVIPIILIITVYGAFRMEIANYWNQLYWDSSIEMKQETGGESEISFSPETVYHRDGDLKSFKSIWLFNYTLVFASALSFLYLKRIRNSNLGLLSLVLLVVTLLFFLSRGLVALSDLRESYMNRDIEMNYHRDSINLWIRFVSYSAVVLALFTIYNLIKDELIRKSRELVTFSGLFMHVVVVWILSSELISLMEIYRVEQTNKLGLSILWGVYSLFLIVLGIWKGKRPLRIGAISLFSLTLLKLFFYDIGHLDTLAKTIVFVSIGLLLLITSFLYNKYKHLIANEETDNT